MEAYSLPTSGDMDRKIWICKQQKINVSSQLRHIKTDVQHWMMGYFKNLQVIPASYHFLPKAEVHSLQGA